MQKANRSLAAKRPIVGARKHFSVVSILCLTAVGPSAAQDTPVNIISDHIRRQGFACEEPRSAQRDEKASRPNETVWYLNCSNAKYRVTLIPDMAAHVELIK